MSFVGPRPNLPNQSELIEYREMHNIYSLLPGITGIAQIKKIDMSDAKLLAETDSELVRNLSFSLYFKLILKTILGSGRGDIIKH